ncbi:MAG: hypothetical protein LBH54_00865 [Clostridiales bacterium]|nr:hypothetical protein [Clostridiales bacterium]
MKTSKFLSLTLALALLCALAPPAHTPAFAEEGDWKTGNALYASLSDAVTAVQSGQTIYLERDAVLPGVQTILLNKNKTYTVDFGGHALSGNSGGNTLITIASGTVTFRNANIDADGFAAIKVQGNAVGQVNSPTLHLYSGYYKADGYAVLLDRAPGGSPTGTLIITQGRFVSAGGYSNRGALGGAITLSQGSGANVNPWQGDGVNDVTITPSFRIGSVYYDTLESAAMSAQNGETIEMVRDVTAADSIVLTVPKTYTIDFGGHTLSGGSGSLLNIGYGTVTLKNGSLQTSGAYAVGVLDSGANVKILSGDYQAATTALLCQSGSTVITSGRFRAAGGNSGAIGGNAVLAPGSAASVTPWQGEGVNDVTVRSAAFHTGEASYNTLEAAVAAAQNGATVEMTQDVVLYDRVTLDADKTYTLDFGGYTLSRSVGTGPLLSVGAGEVSLKNGTLQTATTYCVYVNSPATVHILSGNYYAADDAVWCRDARTVITSGHFRVTGGGDGALVKNGMSIALSSASAASPAAGWSNSANEVTVSVPNPGVFKIGNTLYDAIESAADAARNGETIVMLRDAVLLNQADLYADKTYTIDFGGHTLYGEAYNGLLYFYAGEVTLQDGTLQTTAAFAVRVSDGAAARILSGDYTARSDAVNCQSGGSVVVTSGRFRATEGNDGALWGSNISLAPGSAANADPWHTAQGAPNDVTVTAPPCEILSVTPNAPAQGTVTVDLNRPLRSAVLVVAVYRQGKLLAIAPQAITASGGNTANLAVPGNADEMQAMIWSGTATMEPLCASKKLKKIGGVWTEPD